MPISLSVYGPCQLLTFSGFIAQSLQTLLGGRITAVIEFVGTQRGHVRVDLRARRRYPAPVHFPIILGNTSAANIAMITTTTIISISVTPASLLFRFCKDRERSSHQGRTRPDTDPRGVDRIREARASCAASISARMAS